jgi:hypothetical protein
MARRRSKSRKGKSRGGHEIAAEAPAPRVEEAGRRATPPAAAGRERPVLASPARAAASEGRSDLRPWRGRVQDLLDSLQSWSRAHYGPAVDQWLESRFEGLGGPADAPEADVDRAVEDFVCTPGSAGEGRSILSIFAEQAAGPAEEGLEPEDRDQLRRWERERRRGVFLIQHAARDRLTLWDPLEGAPLTLHLLNKLGAARADSLRRGTVVTATYQPWMARLVAVGEVEFFADERAISLFREEAVGSGARWHEAPPPAPLPTARARK